MLVALLVCLIPTTIGALLSAIGIAGMDRLVQRNVLAMSGRAVEAAGDCSTLLLDKTGTITLGNRQAAEFLPARRRRPSSELADAAQLASLADETPEGRSIVVLAKERFGLRERDLARRHAGAVHRPDPHERRRPRRHVGPQGRGRLGAALGRRAGRHRARPTSTPSSSGVATRGRHAAGRGRGHRGPRRRSTSRTSSRRACASASTSCGRMGIRTVMITGDNPLTAAGHRRPRPASTTSWPRPRPRTRWR